MAKAPSDFALEAPRTSERTATEKRRQRGKAVRRREKHEANKGARDPKSRIDTPTGPFVITNRPPEVRRGGGSESFVERRRDEPAEGWLRYIAKTYGPGRFWVTGANEVVIRLQPTAEMLARFERETEPRANPVAPVVTPVAPMVAPMAPQSGGDVLEELRRLNRKMRRLEARVEEAATVEDEDDDEPRANPVDLEALIEVAVKKATTDAKPPVDPMKLFELAAKLYMQRSPAPAPTPAVNPPSDPKAAAWAAAIPAMEAAGWTPAQVVDFIAAEAARDREQADAGAPHQS